MSRPTIATTAAGHGEDDERWLRRLERLIPGRRGPVAGDFRLMQRNIYILPSRAGTVFIAAVLLMLLTSVNFGLSLGYALTFLLGSLGLVGMMHTFRNLSDLVLRPGRADPVFAGEFAEFGVSVRNPSRLERRAVALIAPGSVHAQFIDLPGGAQTNIAVPVRAERRGWIEAPRLLVQTRFPLGVFRAWAWWQPAMRVLVYPRPEDAGIPLPASRIDGAGSEGGAGQEDDLSALRPWSPGDSPRRIAWKAIARSDSADLLVKQFEGGEAGELVLDFDALPLQFDVEARLSRTARWVLDAEHASRRYSLRLAGRTIGPDIGPAHRADCLAALALHGLGRNAGETP
ncbi:MAG: DUF58 domain-containing protein [Burkholderiaceae bacterium]|jgi:uncharacterized protein (DUF58 family)|nr:DUF58 domain-containing protein [Burkholderiaceae bacterium]